MRASPAPDIFAPVDTTVDAEREAPPSPEVDVTPAGIEALTADPFDDECQPGDVLDSRWKLLGLLGRGGMGAVFEALDLETERYVAIKRLRRNRVGDRDMEARLLREARAVMAVQHPGIVRMIDLGKDDRGRWFLVYELLRGVDLETALTTESLVLGEVWQIGVEALDALAAAHAAGIIHRDIKPANLYLVDVPGGRRATRILDFGVAKQRELEDATRLTASGIVVGTPRYMSPEQARGKPLDGRADVYAMGVVLFRILVGHTPFDEDNVAELMARLLREDVPPLRKFSPDVPEELARVVDRALRRKPEERWASAIAMRDALLGSITLGGMSDGERPPWADQPIPEARPILADTVTTMPPRRRARAGLAWAAAIGLGLVAGGVGFLVVDQLRGPTAEADAPVPPVAEEPSPEVAEAEPNPILEAPAPEPEVEPDGPAPVDEVAEAETEERVASAPMRARPRVRTAPAEAPRMETAMRPQGYRVVRDYE